MIQAGEGYAEIFEAGALREHCGRQLDIADDDDIGIAHALDESVLIFTTIYIIGEVVSQGEVMLAEAFEPVAADAETLYTGDIHGDDVKDMVIISVSSQRSQSRRGVRQGSSTCRENRRGVRRG